MKKRDKHPKVLVASGTSGGHLFPALAFADNMSQNTSFQINFLMAPPKNWKLPEQMKNFTVFRVGAFALPRGKTWKWLVFPFIFLFNSLKVLTILLGRRPSLVIGFGGYVSFPAVFWAKLLRIRTIIHEQNACFGKANRLLKRFSDRVALSFPDAGGLAGEKGVITGNPVRKSFIERSKTALYFPPKKSDKVNILIVGGSQGSYSLNNTFMEALKGFSKEEMNQYRILHITGLTDFSKAFNFYESLPGSLERKVVPFHSDMAEAYEWSHWVLARSGAGTVFELMAIGRPSLLVPYPYAESHQLENARFLEKIGGCEVVEEKILTKEILRTRIRGLRQRANFLKTAGDNAKKSSILDGADRLRQLALSLYSAEVSKN